MAKLSTLTKASHAQLLAHMKRQHVPLRAEAQPGCHCAGDRHFCTTHPSRHAVLSRIADDGTASDSAVSRPISACDAPDHGALESHPTTAALHAWSPDGSVVAVVSQAAQCMEIMTTDQDLLVHVDDDFASVHWSGDGRTLVAVYSIKHSHVSATALVLDFSQPATAEL